MNALSEYFTAKHQSLEGAYKDNCLTIARDIARLLLDQGKEPYIMTLDRFEQRGEDRYYGPLMPLRYRGAATFTRHYVCCCGDQAFDPIHPEPLKINEYSNTLFGIEIPMQMFVPTSGISDYLAGPARRFDMRSDPQEQLAVVSCYSKMNNEALPDRGLISRIERLIGAKVESYIRVSGGYTPAIRLLCRTSSTSFFAKVGATSLTTEFLRREIRMYNSIRGAFLPTLLACEDDESAPILLIEDLSTGYWPPPWDRQRIDMVLEQINIMHNTPTSIESFAKAHGDIGLNWQIVADDPAPFLKLGLADDRWLDAALPILLDYEAQCDTAGHSLTHFDLRSDNICITERGVVFVDWNNACLSNPKFDLGFWLPSLEYEGGPAPEQILPDAPEVAARVSGFFASKAGLPEISDAPRVRLVQKQQLETALPWVIRALDLPPIVMRRLT